MAKAKTTTKPEVKEVVKKPEVETKKEEVKEEVKVEAKIEAPIVEQKPKEKVEETIKVRVLKDFENVYVGGKRYSGKAGTVVDMKKSVAFILRQDGSII